MEIMMSKFFSIFDCIDLDKIDRDIYPDNLTKKDMFMFMVYRIFSEPNDIYYEECVMKERMAKRIIKIANDYSNTFKD